MMTVLIIEQGKKILSFQTVAMETRSGEMLDLLWTGEVMPKYLLEETENA